MENVPPLAEAVAALDGPDETVGVATGVGVADVPAQAASRKTNARPMAARHSGQCREEAGAGINAFLVGPIEGSGRESHGTRAVGAVDGHGMAEYTLGRPFGCRAITVISSPTLFLRARMRSSRLVARTLL